MIPMGLKYYNYIIAIVCSFFIGWVVNGWRMDIAYKEEQIKQMEAKDRMEKELSYQAEMLNEELRKQKDESDKKIKSLTARINSGELRLTVPTTTKCGNSSVELGYQRTELDRETAKSLIGLTDEGDQAIRELNYCIKSYNQVRDSLRN